MKGKRQTIWLVSMLSLMVVLSAYYLFTEDTGTPIPKETAGSIQVDTVKDGAGGGTATTLDSGLVIKEVSTDKGIAVGTVNESGKTAKDEETAAVVTEDDTTPAVTEDTGVVADTGTTDKDKAKTEDKAEDKAASATVDKDKDTKDAKDTKDTKETAASAKTPEKNDEAILDEVASQSVSASSLFTNYLYEREQKNLKDHNDLLALINDMDKTPAENAMAQEQLSKLEEKESKITGIEEKLQQKYGEAIVKEEAGDAYTIVVLSDKLDVKQAVGIVDFVMKELSVTQDKIKVQYVSEQ
ncbi:SpoIIIAH-like family protein [Paenibacillus tritici]|uniref:SpoIIIAH-like family protein n=1 Tax=Paenibacillus tritici TaxID=1873425 RepID=A0ABX2DK34_9BACL|nr:SpoIIIAH-like family protein [Paenibacillus tritici]NQX44981.1 SpoIIIAH-like family protein [Paenibacillus tritici]QUL53032.1 SpoIIIAH-like family protein [Paenibacillus tritici]